MYILVALIDVDFNILWWISIPFEIPGEETSWTWTLIHITACREDTCEVFLLGWGSFPPVATGTCPSCPLAQVDMAASSPQPPCVHQLWVHYRFAWSQSFSSSKFTRSSLIWGTRVTAHSQAALIAPDETWVWFCWRPCIKRQHNRRALSNSSAA